MAREDVADKVTGCIRGRDVAGLKMDTLWRR